MKIARIIITFSCGRKCMGCCNTYSWIMKHAIKINDLSILSKYDIVLITGGEPLLDPDWTLQVIEKIRKDYPKIKIFLYTALYTERMKDVIAAVDGAQYSLHEGATINDIQGLQAFQALISQEVSKSFRLYIDPRITHSINIQPNVWLRVEIKQWMSEEELLALQPNGLPHHKTLFIYTKQE